MFAARHILPRLNRSKDIDTRGFLRKIFSTIMGEKGFLRILSGIVRHGERREGGGGPMGEKYLMRLKRLRSG